MTPAATVVCEASIYSQGDTDCCPAGESQSVTSFLAISGGPTCPCTAGPSRGVLSGEASISLRSLLKYYLREVVLGQSVMAGSPPCPPASLHWTGILVLLLCHAPCVLHLCVHDDLSSAPVDPSSPHLNVLFVDVAPTSR